MAGAIVEGMAASGQAPHAQVVSAHGSAAALAKRTGARLAPSSLELARSSEVVVLAVKPQVVPAVLAELVPALDGAKPLVVSLAAGLTTQRLEQMLPPGARVVRAMPNMAAGVRQSLTALCAGSTASTEDLEVATELMSVVGRTMVLPEHLFPAFTALAGSSPAFVLTFIEALARAGVQAGIPKAQAVDIATQALVGTALTVQAESARSTTGGRGRTPASLVDAVCSPGGTTVAGLVALEREGFSPAVIAAVEATIVRDLELGS